MNNALSPSCCTCQRGDLGVLLSAALGKNQFLRLLVRVHMTRNLPEGRGGEQGSVLDVWGGF